jgi:membrane protease YdiL (CAAX protease family)
VSIDEAASPLNSQVETRYDAPALAGGPASTVPPDPNNPPWGVPQAVLLWLLSMAMLFVVPLIAIIPLIVYRLLTHGSVDNLGTDPTLIFISILSVFPAHVLTFAIAWFVVTRRGHRPFWPTLGWSWPENFGPWKTVGLAITLLALGALITRLFGGSETQLDQIINSSMGARFATAFLAAATGPLVEELVYRGVLYPVLQRAFGMLWAIIVVSTLFAGVHVLQYYKNLGVIAVIALLSFSLTIVRARTGKLLPSYVMHLVFNGIQALYLILQPFFEKPTAEKNAAVGFITHALSRFLA